MTRLRWIVVLLVILGCSMHPQAQSRCPSFLTFPDEKVIIPPGGSRTISCAYNRSAPLPPLAPNDSPSLFPQVDWYRDDATLTPQREEECSCLPMDSSTLLNLTFMNFRNPEHQGSYRCGARVSFLSVTVYCDFRVYLAAGPTINLDSSHVTGAVLQSPTLKIAPMIDRGMPEADIMWTHQPPHLSLDGNSRASVGVNGSLTITDVVAGDRGTYSVTATNSQGSDSGSVDVFLTFVEVSTSVRTVGDNFELTCVVTGYPLDQVRLEWFPAEDNNFIGQMTTSEENTFDKVFTSVSMLPMEACGNINYRCTGSIDSGHSISVLSLDCPTPPDVEPPTNVEAVDRGFTAIRVTWDPPAPPLPTGYRVQYYPTEASGVPQEMDVPASPTSYIITGLIPNTEYTVNVASLGQGDPVYATQGDTAMTPICRDTTRPMQLASVQARLHLIQNERTINVSWTREKDMFADRFMVNVVARDEQGSTPSTDTVDNSTTSYLLPTDFCNGSTYIITVSALNICGQPGPPSMLTQTCTNENGNALTVKITSSQSSAFHLSLSRNTDRIIQSILLNATTLNLSPEGKISTSVFASIAYPQSGSLCIKGLKAGSFYNVCVTPVYDNGPGYQDEACVQGSTTESGSSDLDECLVAANTFNSTRPPPASEFPDWAIAVIVVGALALVALLFCFIGLCFACSTGDGKDDDLASMSSIQGSSIVPGSVGPYPNMRRNNMSPHRSCLSYHREGHSTNWNEHRDTLKQMETDIGTNV